MRWVPYAPGPSMPGPSAGPQHSWLLALGWCSRSLSISSCAPASPRSWRWVRVWPDGQRSRLRSVSPNCCRRWALKVSPMRIRRGSPVVRSGVLSVAAMMAPRPQLLIVDEPTFGQDALTWAGLVGQFLDVLARGSTVVAISHDHAFLEAIGARCVVLGGAQRRMAGTNRSWRAPRRGERIECTNTVTSRSSRSGSAHSACAQDGAGQVQSADEDRCGAHPHGRDLC